MAKSPIDPRAAVAAAGFLTAIGCITGGVALAPAIAAATPGTTAAAMVVVNVGCNLVSSGISYLCDRSAFARGRLQRELLINHHIVDMVRLATAEASVAAVRLYADRHRPGHSFSSVTSTPPPEAFLKLLERLGKEDFPGSGLEAGDIRNAVEVTRRGLLPESSQTPPPGAEAVAPEMNAAMAQSIAQTVADKIKASKTPDLEVPDDFKAFLEGPDGVLAQLTGYVAMYLKTNESARLAVMHSAQQQLLDGLAQVIRTTEETLQLCNGILAMQKSGADELRGQLLGLFEKEAGRLAAQIEQEVKRAFDRQNRPPLKDPRNTGEQKSLNRLTFAAQSTALLGREQAVDALMRFIDAPDRVLWTVVSGAAGTGKSRLALELVAALTDEEATAPDLPVRPGYWRAGFLNSPEWLHNQAPSWDAECDTLIVIDSTSLSGASFAERMQAILVHLHTRLKGRSRHERLRSKVRIVLLDRVPPDSDQGIARRIGGAPGSILDDQDNASTSRWRPQPPQGADDPFALEPLEEAEALEVASAYAHRSLTPEETFRLTAAFDRDRELARPLFAALIGDAIQAGKLPEGELNPIVVAKPALDRQLFNLQEASPTHLREVQNLLALATASEGLDLEGVLGDAASSAFITGDTGARPLGDYDVEAISRGIRRLCLFLEDGLLAPLKPDYLGELFVLDVLLRLPPQRTSKRAFQMMQAAWKYGRNPGGFLFRLAGDFAHRREELALALTARQGKMAVERASALLAALFRSAATRPALGRDGADALIGIVYACALLAADDLSRRALDALFAAPAPARAQAAAWFTYALSGDLPNRTPERSDKALGAIRVLSKSGADSTVRELFAMALVNRSNDLANDGKLDEAGKLLDELRKVHSDHEEPAVRKRLAKALFNLAIYLANDGELDRVGELVNELRTLNKNYPEPTVRELFARALVNRSIDLAKGRKLDQAGELLDELRTLHGKHPEPAVRKALAMALFNRSKRLAKDSKLDQAGELVDELRRLHDKYPEPAVRERLANALALDVALAMINRTLERWQKSLEELLELARSHPDDAAVQQVMENVLKALQAAEDEEAGSGDPA